MKRVIGFDPGLAIVGYGVMDYEGVNNKKVVDYGVITTPKDESFPVRLALIYESVTKLIETYKPDEIAAEELFFNTNITTGINRCPRARSAVACRHTSLWKAVRVHAATNQASNDGLRARRQKANSANGQGVSRVVFRPQAG